MDTVASKSVIVEKKKAREKLLGIVDPYSFREIEGNLISGNPLCFKGYDEKLKNAIQFSGENEAVIAGHAKLGGISCMVFILEPQFMMGSIGSIAGEKITRAFEIATRKRLPVVSFSASGGARMQEGVLSLMQMAKTSGAVSKHSRKKLLYVSVICDPTMGGVTASYASLADIIVVEENARFGFTGRRIVEYTTKRSLPDDFQKASYSQRRGQADLIVKPECLRDTLITLLMFHKKK